MTRESDSTIRRGSGNVFADLGRPDPDTHLLKAQLVNRMHELCATGNLPRRRRPTPWV